MSSAPGIAELYVAAVDSFVDVARTLTDDQWATPAPCTPGWTARDLLSHVSGIPDDALAGRLDGVATEPWTASQVERNAVFTVDELLERWLAQYRPFAAAIEAGGQGRPPFDCHTHEHDLRHAVGRLGGRGHPVIDALAGEATGALEHVRVSLTVDFTDGGTHAAGGGGPAATVSLSRFEYFRSRFGRRSAAQLAAYDWSGDPEAIAAAQDGWWFFGIADEDILE